MNNNRKKIQSTFFKQLSDDQAEEELVLNKKYDVYMAEDIVSSWRKLATEIDHAYGGPIAWKVKAGFTLQEHVEKTGPCFWDNGFFMNAPLANNMPTQGSLAFFVPRLIKKSKGKNVEQQLSILFALRQKYSLPGHHLCSFGQASMLCGLILEYYNRTNNCILGVGECSRTDTFALHVTSLRGRYSSSLRLVVGPFYYNSDEMANKQLHCRPCSWNDKGSSSSVGCFPLGVELIK